MTTGSYIPSFSNAFASASSYTSDFYQGAKSFSYEMGKETLRQSVTLAPAAAVGVGQALLNNATGLNLTDSFGYGLGAYQMIQGTWDLAAKPIQALRGKVALFSPESLKEMGYSTVKVAVGAAMLFAPSDIYPEDMTNAQRLLWSTLIINSLVSAGYLAKKSYSNLQESHLLEKVSPFNKSKAPIQWEKVAKSVSSATLGSLCVFGAYKKMEGALGQRFSSWMKGPADVSKVMEHLPDESAEKVQAFLTTNARQCNYSRDISGKQLSSLGGSALWECTDTHERIRDDLIANHPELLAEIYQLREERYPYTLQSFLNKAEKHGADLDLLTPSEIKKFSFLFSCYGNYELEKIFASHKPVTTFDTSRCYEQNEFSLLKDKGILDYVGQGNNEKPAIFLRAVSDWNGALDSKSYDRYFKYGSIDFMKDHKNLYSGTVVSAEHMCEQFAKAREALGTKIQEVYLNAHGSPEGMLFSGKGFHSKGFYTHTSLPQGCFKDNIAEDATVILQSCSTANDGGMYFFFENIAGRISKLVPKGKVIASKDYTYGSATKYELNESGESVVDLGPATVIRRAGDSFSLSKFLFG